MIRLGTRRSALATAQATLIADALRNLGHEVELVLITTTGDVNRAPVEQIGGTGIFVSALRDALQAFAPRVAVRDGRIVAYATTLNFWPMAYGVAETEDDMKGLLLGAAEAAEEPLALLVPLRSGLFPWCLAHGMRALKPMNVMARGPYDEPQGSWFPSVLY